MINDSCGFDGTPMPGCPEGFIDARGLLSVVTVPNTTDGQPVSKASFAVRNGQVTTFVFRGALATDGQSWTIPRDHRLL